MTHSAVIPTTPFPLRVTDIDRFQHVNNTVYRQGIHEVLAQETDLAISPYRAVVEYRRPIKPREPVMLHSDDTTTVCGSVSLSTALSVPAHWSTHSAPSRFR